MVAHVFVQKSTTICTKFGAHHLRDDLRVDGGGLCVRGGGMEGEQT